MSEVIDYFVWTHQLHCPPAICNNLVKKRLCKGVLEFLWEDISSSIFPITEVQKIRKNILLYKLRHGLDDLTIASIKDLMQLRSNNDILQHQISVSKENYEDLDHNIRQKMQQLKDIRIKYSTINIKQNLLKLKHNETSQQLKDCGTMRQICQCLMPNTSKDIDENKLRESLNVITSLRQLKSAADRKQIWEKVSRSLSAIDTHTLWSHLYQALSQDLDMLMKLEIKDDINSFPIVGEHIDIGIARICGQRICTTLRCMLSDAKANKLQQSIVKFIELIESLSNEDVNRWLILMLEIKKLETEQTCLQNKVQELNNNIQDSSLLNFEIAQLTTDIETIDTQMNEYVKNIEKSIAILNSTASVIFKAKEKLHCELQKIAALRTEEYDPWWLNNNALNIELSMFHNNLDLNALWKIMLKGDVGQYRHAICGFDRASVTAISPQCSRIKAYFPMIHTPIYTLIDCYKHAVANVIYTKAQCSTPTEDVKCVIKSVPSPEKHNNISLELLNLSRVVCDQVREEIESFNATLDSWMCQDVQKVMQLIEITVDDVPFKDWLQRYSSLLYMIQKTK